MHLATRSSKRVPGKGDKDELIEAVFPLPTTPPPWLISTSDEGERTIIRKHVKVLCFFQHAKSPQNMPAPYFNLSYKQHAAWLLSWPPPWREKPAPGSFRENGPNSRTSGTAQGKGRPEVLRVQIGKAEERKQEGYSDNCPGSEGSWPGAQLHQTKLLPGGLSAGVCRTVPSSSLQWLPIVPGTWEAGGRLSQAGLRMWLQMGGWGNVRRRRREETLGQTPAISPLNIQLHPVTRKTKVWGKGKRKVISFIISNSTG